MMSPDDIKKIIKNPKQYILPIIIICILFIVGTYISEKIKQTVNRKSKAESYNQYTSGNDTTQIITYGNGSPVTNIAEQKVYLPTPSSPQTPEMIEVLKRKSMWSVEQGFKGDRNAYSRLLLWQKKPKDEATKDIIDSAIKDIENAYAIDVMRLNIELIRNPHRWWICRSGVSDCSLGFEEPTGFKANNIISHFPRQYWQERGRAVAIIRNIKTAPDKKQVDKESFFNKLIERMGPTENSLFVAKMALETYKDLTGFEPKSNKTFDFQEAIDNWNDPKTKERILKIEF